MEYDSEDDCTAWMGSIELLKKADCSWHTTGNTDVFADINNYVNMWLSKGKGKATPAHAINAYKGSGVIAPLILHLSTRWRWVVSFMPWLFYPYRKTLYYPL